MKKFQLVSEFHPAGDQNSAIQQLTEGVQKGIPYQILLGVTGSGKTFTMANVVELIGKPTLVISPNKILAAQLYAEFKAFFPQNAVEYFISYYDYYQPEAYVPQTDTYIEKDASINDHIDLVCFKVLRFYSSQIPSISPLRCTNYGHTSVAEIAHSKYCPNKSPF